MTDENYEWAGVHKATDELIVANYYGRGVSDKKVVTLSFMYNYEETEKIIKEIKIFMFSDLSEFVMKYNCSEQVVIMRVSWDNIIEFINDYIRGRENKKIVIAGEIKEQF